MYGTILEAGDTLTHQLEQGRRAYVHVARGEARINGQLLVAGDGLSITQEEQLEFEGIESAEILLFDLN